MDIFYAYEVSDGYARMDAEESAHCVRVLRKRAGDEVDIIDGNGSLLHCRICDDSPKAAVAKVLEEKKGFGTHPYRLTLAVCPTKNMDRYEWFAEKATELGVDVICPVIGERSERKVLKEDRLRRLVLAAVKQSLKGCFPEVREALSVKEFCQEMSGETDTLKLICYCSDEIRPRSSAMQAVREFVKGKGEPGICILIGPEGDFSPEEVKAAMDAGFVPVPLGPSRLRTETAAVTAAETVYLNFV